MKTLKKTTLLLLLSITIFGCGTKDEVTTTIKDFSIATDGTLTGKIPNYTEGVLDSVVGFFYNAYPIVTKPQSDGKFTMKLVFRPELLHECTYWFSSLIGVQISDMATKIATNSDLMDIGICYKSGKNVAMLNITDVNLKSEYNFVQFIYSDRDCTIKGTNNRIGSSTIYDLNLKKGWNAVAYISVNTTDTITTTIPVGFQLNIYSTN